MPTLSAPDARTLAALTAARPTPNCNIEIATLTPGVRGEATLSASGWLSEFAAQVTSPEGFVALSGPGGRWTAPIRLDKARPDVAAFYKNPTGLQSGFVGSWFVRKLPAGAYVVSAYRRSGSGWIACQNKRTLVAP